MRLPTIKVSVENFHNKNQFLIRYTNSRDNWIMFQSYGSECAMYNQNTGTLFLNLNCWLSKTTSKHLYLFINEMTRLSCHNCNELKELIEEKEIKTYRR